MALMTPSTAATMPSAGRPSATVDHGVIGFQLVGLDGLDFLVHQRLDLVRAGIADDDEAAVVADERRQIVVLRARVGKCSGRSGIAAGSSKCASTSLRDLPRSSRISAVEHAEHVEVVAALGRGVA